MYRRSTPGQLSFENFYLPFGGKLSGENRWVKLAELIPWEEFEAQYAEQLSEGIGAPAKSFRMALGALIIKERLGTSDIETVEQIRENRYLQFFLGLSEYSDTAPFDASMLVHFRKRVKLELIGQINEAIIKQSDENDSSKQEGTTEPSDPTDEDNDDNEPPSPTNAGQLIVDASCTPCDIRYPTDLSLLNEAREQTERIIDLLYEQVREQVARKPRTYRRQARQQYLHIAKQRQTKHKALRKAVGQQLRYLKRNLAHIDRLIAVGASLAPLDEQLYRKLLVVSELFRQQQWMYQPRQHRIDDRIVSIAQPHIRPIVRGKAGTSVEFGAKIAISCVDGYVFLDHLDWNNFNESTDLPEQIERFKRRFGHYPASVHADQIYRTRANRKYCQERGIRLSGKPLGRPNQSQQADVQKQAQADAAVRNQVEGKFGVGKRRFSLARVMAKLAPTAETAIAVTLLVMNLEQLLRQSLFVFFAVVLSQQLRPLNRWQWHWRDPQAFLRVA
ncbi:IS5 family transposase [Leptolyngbya ohadii]|uniref:IS5 family transposase n=1 Tax=Leptolyngbya ohadii TaxID=1962290 RepID=UPI000B59DC60|nr:IS5 family transposase [Leptolyngbya ohadii]